MRFKQEKEKTANAILPNKKVFQSSEKKMEFFVYRYQLPVATGIFDDPEFNSEHLTVEKVRQQKNDIFSKQVKDICEQIPNLTNKMFSALFIAEIGNLLFVILGKKSRTKLKDSSLVQSRIEEHYNNQIVIIFDNDPNEQIIAIQNSQQVRFSAVERGFLKKLAQKLETVFLTFHYNPISSTQNFWEILKSHKGKVSDLKFTIYAENMSSYNADVAEMATDLRGLMDADELSLQASAKKGLKIEPSNKSVVAMQNCAKDGLGVLVLRTREGKKKNKTVIYDSSKPELAETIQWSPKKNLDGSLKTTNLKQEDVADLKKELSHWKIEQK